VVPLVVRAIAQLVRDILHFDHFQNSFAVGDDVLRGAAWLAGDRLNWRRPAADPVHRIEERKAVWLQRAWRRPEQNVQVVLLVRLVRHDRRALREIRAQAAGVIEMMVRVDHVLNGLLGSESRGFCDHGKRAFFVVGRIHDRDVVLELDEKAVMRSASK